MAHSTDQKQYPPPPMGAPPPMLGVPLQQGLPPQASLQWTTGLCGCTEDVGNCFMTFCCPCVTFGKIAEIVDRGSSSCGASGAMYVLIAVLTGCQCIYSCTYRSKMRALYGLPESPCPDFLLHCCCEACALCQEYRELKNRGFDMEIGWHANMERQQGQQMMMTQPPAMQPGMYRST